MVGAMSNPTPPPTLQEQLLALAAAGEQEDARQRAANVHEHVLQQLLSKSWAELEVIECEGHMLFPESLYRRNLKGTFTAEPVMVRVPRDADTRKARVEARQWALEEGMDLDRDRDLIEEMETMCVLQRCILNPKAAEDPRTGKEFREPWCMDAKELEKRYDRPSLHQLWAKLDALGQVLDPRPNTLGKEEMLAALAAIAKSRTIAPLHVYGPGAQKDFIVFMAQALLSFLDSKS